MPEFSLTQSTNIGDNHIYGFTFSMEEFNNHKEWFTKALQNIVLPLTPMPDNLRVGNVVQIQEDYDPLKKPFIVIEKCTLPHSPEICYRITQDNNTTKDRFVRKNDHKLSVYDYNISEQGTYKVSSGEVKKVIFDELVARKFNMQEQLMPLQL